MSSLTRIELPDAITEAVAGATLKVVNDTVKELGEIAAERMGRKDIKFVVENED